MDDRDFGRAFGSQFLLKDGDNRYYIRVSNFDHEILPLLDTGATLSVVGAGGIPFLRKFNINIQQPDIH